VRALSTPQYTAYAVPSFTYSKDMIGGQNLKKTGHVTLTTPARDSLSSRKLTLDIFCDLCTKMPTLASAVPGI